jgi:phospholipase/lecithinase/hemolysin
MQRRAHAPNSRARVLFLETLEDRVTPSVASSLVVFGDSLSDVGNTSLATLASGNQTPPPQDASGNSLYFYTNPFFGRFSNGPIWVDTLAEYLGVSPLVPFAAGTGGTDYAFGGSTLTPGLSDQVFGTPSINEQIEFYLAGVAAQQPQGILGPHSIDSSAVIALWGGADDFFSSLHGQPLPSPSSVAAAMRDDIALLMKYGADHFVVPNLPPLGQTPFYQDQLEAALKEPATSPSRFGDILKAGVAVLQADAWSAAFDIYLKLDLNALQAAHRTATITQVDTFGIFENLARPGNPLGLTNFDDAVAHYDPFSGFIDQAPTVDTSKYVFFDSVHPTTVVQQYIGLNAAAEVLTDLHVHTIDVSASASGINPLDGAVSLAEANAIIQLMPGHQTIHYV